MPPRKPRRHQRAQVAGEAGPAGRRARRCRAASGPDRSGRRLAEGDRGRDRQGGHVGPGDPSANDPAWRRHDRRLRRRGRDRRRPTLSGSAQTRQLPRAEPERPPVGRRTSPAWPDHQAGPRPGPRNAGGGGMGRRAISRSVPRVLPADRGAPWQAYRRRRHRPEDGHGHLAHADQGNGLHLGAAGLARSEVQGHRTASRLADRAQQTRRRL